MDNVIIVLIWRLVVKSKLGSLSLLALTIKLQSHFVFGSCSASKQCDFLYFIGSKLRTVNS